MRRLGYGRDVTGRRATESRSRFAVDLGVHVRRTQDGRKTTD
jgi:hypothetical protein